MTEEKKKRLEAAGFQVGTLAEFLELTIEEQNQINNVIIRNGKPIGICNCNGQGKDSCRGNGWVRDGSGYQHCPRIVYFE